MRRILRARLFDLEDKETAAKRGGGVRPLDLNEPLAGSDESDDESLTLSDVITDQDPELSPETAMERVLLRDRVDQAIRQLPSEQRDLARHLRNGWSVAETSRALGIPRATIYDLLRRMQRAFRDQGLEEFLR